MSIAGTERARRTVARSHPDETDVKSSGVVRLFYALSLLSGAAALVYQVTWARILSLAFGSTTLAAATVVAGFMGGMAIGAWGYRFLQRFSRRPAVLYGLLELGIALTTAILTPIFYGLPPIFARISESVGGPGLTAVRLVSAFVLLLVPTALMGATFPALCTAIIATARGLDRHLGLIYGLNTLGAGAGVVVGGLWLIPSLGLSRSVYVANAVNVLVGATALAAWSRIGMTNSEGESRRIDDSAIPTLLPRACTAIVLIGSGFTTLAYEILWFRSFRFLVGNSTYALSAVLFVFLLGLGVGAMLLRPLVRTGRAEERLALCQTGIAVFALFTLVVQMLVLGSPFFREHVSIFSTEVIERPWGPRWLANASVAALAMLPSTVLMGLSFPLASRLFVGDVRRLGSSLGGACFLANIGSISGTVLAALLILPLFGAVGGTKLLAGVNATMGLLVAASLPAGSNIRRPFIAIGAGLWLIGALVSPSSIPLRGEKLEENVAGERVFQEESDLATVQVLAHPTEPDKRKMLIDGYGIGWDRGFRNTSMYRKQVLLAHLPMILDTRLTNSLNVGLGSGVTLETLGRYPSIQSLDCVEISEAVVRAARLFTASAILEDPRTSLIVDDAVHFLLRTNKTYDLIASDGKQNAAFSGNATLLCREYYELAAKRLHDYGLFVQWLPTNLLESEVRINLHTLAAVFPVVELFFEPRDSLFIVAAKQPLSGRPTMNHEQFRELGLLDDLRPYGLPLPIAVMARWVGGKPEFEPMLRGEPLSTWDLLYLDFSSFAADADDWNDAGLRNLNFLIGLEEQSRGRVGTPVPVVETPWGRSAAAVRRAFRELLARRPQAAFTLVKQAIELNPDDAAARAVELMLQRMTPNEPPPP